MTSTSSLKIDYAMQESTEIIRWISNRLNAATNNVPDALSEASKAHLATEGKRLRGRIAFQAATIFGADLDTSITWAAAVELIHNASLIHDDVCDRDNERRGKKTTFNQYGEALAVCLGDYYISTAFHLAALTSPKTIIMLCDAVTRSTGGQAAEFKISGYPSWSRYCEIAVQKTSPLLSLPVIGAAMLSDYPVDQVILESYFSNAAICFQVINDINNFSASSNHYEPCSDLINCRPNALISCFRDGLKAPIQSTFDHWSDRIRTDRQPGESAETLMWWQQLRQSQSLAHTAQRLNFHFNMASNELNRLPVELQGVLSKFHVWLEYERSKVNVSALSRKE